MSRNVLRRIALLGATGSIGTSSLEVIGAASDSMSLIACSCHRQWEQLARIAHQFQVETAVISDATIQNQVDVRLFPEKTNVLFGEENIEQIASDSQTDTVISAIVGAAGIQGSWAAIEAGKRLAVANKETLVIAGAMVMKRAKETGAEIIPVDSEHSAIFQALKCGQAREVSRLILTASGGPFRELSQEEMKTVTPERALKHPTWDMGPKITIDSATMLNKAMEIIEAKWLFEVEVDQIDVMIHPQSVIHSMVEFVDGSTIAQLSPPDMKLPIQYALSYPLRMQGISPRLDLTRAYQLDLLPPDREKFPALDLGFEVAEKGGTCGAVLNAAKEVAVDRFLNREISFLSITKLCREVLDSHHFEESPTISQILHIDKVTREEAQVWAE